MCALQTLAHGYSVRNSSEQACKRCVRVLAEDGWPCARTSQHAYGGGGLQPRELRGRAQVTGQNADMADLQRLMMRGRTKLNAGQQQNLTVRPHPHLSHSRVLPSAGGDWSQQPHVRARRTQAQAPLRVSACVAVLSRKRPAGRSC